MSGFRLSIFTFILAALGLRPHEPLAGLEFRRPPRTHATSAFRRPLPVTWLRRVAAGWLPWTPRRSVVAPSGAGGGPSAVARVTPKGGRAQASVGVAEWARLGSCSSLAVGLARVCPGLRSRKWARVLPSWPRAAATVATVAATTSRPTSAALGAVVPANPEPMTGQGQSAAAGSAAWSTVFRHVRYENLVAGVSGGVLSNLALHPLDLVKIRFAGKSRPTPRAASLTVSPSEPLNTQRRRRFPQPPYCKERPEDDAVYPRYPELESGKGDPANVPGPGLP